MGRPPHRPVLLQEVLGYLRPGPDRLYVDCTIGDGGHTLALLQASAPTGRVIGIDRDGHSLHRASQRLCEWEGRLTLVHESFQHLRQVLEGLAVYQVDGIMWDLGVVSHQLDTAERGFSFRQAAPLDMRMDCRQEVTAAQLVNTLPREELYRIFRLYGEERWSHRIARAIVEERKRGAIVTTTHLATLVCEVVPSPYRTGHIHPATRVFQALRIAVNDELQALRLGLEDALTLVVPGSRLCVISYHSLEDRIVKETFRRWLGKRGEGIPLVEILTDKPIVPTRQEVQSNPRSRSAKLRVAERLAGELP